jgi:hypothetical protein
MTTMRNRLVGALLLAGVVLTSACAARVVVPGPPGPRVEVIGVAPSPLHIWDPGHWVRVRGGWDWVPGHWIVAPYEGGVWVPGHWVERHGDWVWIEGHWRRR